MPDEAPQVPIDIDVLGTLLCRVGQVHVGVDYCIGIETMLAADRERAIGVLRRLHDNYSPEQVAHIVQQLGVVPRDVPDDRGGGSF